MSQQASLSQLTFGMDEDSLLIERMCDVIESSDSDGGTHRAMPRLFASPSYIMTSLLPMLGKHGWCVFKREDKHNLVKMGESLWHFLLNHVSEPEVVKYKYFVTVLK